VSDEHEGRETAVGALRADPDKCVFEGDVLRIRHDWGDDYDVQAGGWNGEPEDTWLSEHVLRRFEGKRVRVTVEVVTNGAGDA